VRYVQKRLPTTMVYMCQGFSVCFVVSSRDRTITERAYRIIHAKVFCSSALHSTSVSCSEIGAVYYDFRRKRGRSDDRRTSLGVTPRGRSVPRIWSVVLFA